MHIVKIQLRMLTMLKYLTIQWLMLIRLRPNKAAYSVEIRLEEVGGIKSTKKDIAQDTWNSFLQMLQV